ncbi:PQQ-dependent sugar dehydrogenase [Cohaesibacter haloalkalitolerans]|uniref:PQQ-dependent sugar dehydrogenase n=1 Tax=Cohaesibacter haloalkalitolerans TaxID=1162980 RepID=UPI000E64CD64|nr:PQQ-dependent sugar dehydrogenase [Cohaesibacter haloalkalitolerans]
MNVTTFAQLLAVGLIAGASPALSQSFNEAPPNAEGQRPAFAGQTRAPILADGITLERTVIARGLDHPWGMDQLPDGRWLVTERSGSLRIIGVDGSKSRAITGLPEVDARQQGGLLDVTIRDDFASTRRVWWSYAEPRGNGTNATAVATGTLSADEKRMEDVEVIFQQQPAWRSANHFGSRLVFDNIGALFVTTGERYYEASRQLAQDIETTLGKVVRITPMGGAAAGNPMLPGGLPEIWSYGHRNIQSAALGPDGTLWTVEHGPKGGDELNHPQAGRNYGWPIIAYGENYSGTPVGEGLTAKDGMEQPVYYWDPVVAPSGMVFYDGAMFPEWHGDALIGGLASQALVRLKLDGEKVTGEARYLEGRSRIRDVDVDATDGSIVILTDAANGTLTRLTRR